MKHSVDLSHGKNISSLLLAAFLSGSILFISCGKEDPGVRTETEKSNFLLASASASRGFGEYRDLPAQTLAELQAAKAATAQYNNFDNAIRDGYVDINVVVPEMGYHFLLVDRLDAEFHADKPEILVYNKEENGRMKLLAVEYAVPIALSVTAPAGFTGNEDHWSIYQNTLWTLHAWVWEYNPAGVFHSTNPLVHVH